ncbi:MAG TPA: hypothetical protein VFL19_02755, partial [Nitrospira sp.]|nr:hypothetical protein [Nitrospira sp.]
MTTDESTSPMFDDPEKLRCFSSQVSYEGGVDLGRVPLHTFEKPMDRLFDVGRLSRGQPAQIRLNLTEFTFQYGLYERRFAREAAVQGL